MRFRQLLHGDATPWAVTFTIGSIVALCGTCFLSSPRSQCKKMFKKTRVGATVAYVLSMAATLAVAAYGGGMKGQAGVLILCVAIQWIAIVWYTLSYTPFARDAAKACVKKGCCGEECC